MVGSSDGGLRDVFGYFYVSRDGKLSSHFEKEEDIRMRGCLCHKSREDEHV